MGLVNHLPFRLVSKQLVLPAEGIFERNDYEYKTIKKTAAYDARNLPNAAYRYGPGTARDLYGGYSDYA